MRLETARLIIRSFEPEDAEAWVALFDDPDVTRYLPAGPKPTADTFLTALERRRSLERDRGFSVWAVERKSSHAFIGQCGLYPAEGKGPEIEIAYHYQKACWGKGYATEAATAVLDYAFLHTDLDHVIGFVMPPNIGSYRVLEKAGMRFVGDVDVYGMTGIKKYSIERSAWSPRQDTDRR